MTIFIELIKKYKDTIGNLSIYFFANIIQVIVSLILTPLTSTYLSYHDFSVIGYFNSFNLFITPFIGFSFASYYAKNYFKITEIERKKMLSTLLVGQAALGIISIIILLICLKIYFLYNSVHFDFFPYSIYIFGVIYFNNFYGFYLMNYKLSKKPKDYVKLNMLQLTLNTIAAVLFVVILKKGANGSMGGYFLATFIIGLYSFRKQVINLKIDYKILSSAIRFSWPLMFSALMTYFFNGFDRLLLEKKGNVIEFGLYNVADKIAGFFSIFVVAINTTFEPDFYSAINQKNLKKLINVILLMSTLIFVPVVIFLLMGDFVVGMLTNFKYSAAANYTRILVFSNFIRSISFSLSTVTIAYGFTKISLVEKLVGSVFAILINYILINKFGFYGGAWAQSINYLVMSLISFFILFFLYKKHYIY